MFFGDSLVNSVFPLFCFVLCCNVRAALTATSKLYDSVDDALHRLVRESNQRGRDLEALGRLAGLVDKLEKVCEAGKRKTIITLDVFYFLLVCILP